MTIGNKALIDLLLNDFAANLDALTQKKLSAMHCAAQTYSGYMSILVLVKDWGRQVNVRDSY